ncbi:nocobactin polyketide synthase NbtC [Mycobacterium shinjukuense]|uniref:nocobactin polyketide synthase NbtC n=1 Tax=Mycobacterium shinjukuense TaxID=398694 RepID=UPI001E369A0A|nr:nocobactin polyketide synthase NbtC [Mycobacterium shinjukuense]
MLPDEAAALLCYAADHPDVTPQAIADMLFRTRIARRHRILAMVGDREQLVGALQAVVDGREHPCLVRANTPATARRLGYVFPGQGVQRPGMGRLFYQSVPAFRAEADRCAEAFQALLGSSPLDYLLDEQLPARDRAGTVQPALFTQMAGLAAMWRSFGVAPAVTIGHSQGEIAAAYVSGMITLADAVRVVGIRARVADEFACGDYAMAVVAADRDTCEELIARCPGWAQLSVVNSPSMVGISGDRDTIEAIVGTLTQRGTFARVIPVHYPAHTSVMHGLGEKLRASTRRDLQHPTFLDTGVDCLGATLGGPITSDLPVDQYWFWNLRNTVRFDKAVAAAVRRGLDTFVELADHPTLQLAIQDNLASLAALHGDTGDRNAMVVGTSNRTATDLDEFTRNLALLAVHHVDYPWECLRTACDGPIRLPLLDFPNTRMNETRLWLPYDQPYDQGVGQHTAATSAVESVASPRVSPRLLAETWVRLAHRSLVPPRAIGIVDDGGACARLATALCAAAAGVGATARVIDGLDRATAADVDTCVILVPPSPKLDDRAAAGEVATFFSHRGWWPGVSDTVCDCWLVTVGGETVVADDGPPDPVHAAASAGFRCIGAEHPGVRFCHLDLPAGATSSDATVPILTALHTRDESELALRGGGLYAKRIVDGAAVAGPQITSPDHVLIVGGTGSVGLEFCDHFARRGARRITLVSRSGETDAVADRLRRIRSAAAAQIQVTRCDVGDPVAVSALAQQHREAPADVIIHAAVRYSGNELADLTTERIEQALRAKVVGICRVLESFPRTADCRLVLCSSIAATVGGRGLIAYAAANRMLDAMAHRLRAEGLDCVSVQWGQWSVTFDPDAAGTSRLSVTGLLPMSSNDALALGMRRMGGNAIVAAFELSRARSALETCGRGSLLSQLADSDIGETTAPAGDPGLPERLLKLVAGTIGVDRAETIDTEAPLVAIGLDSLQALELRRRVKTELDHDLDVSTLLGGASVADVLAQLAE